MNMSRGSSRIKFTPAYVNRLAPAAKPYRQWDSEVPKLFLRLQPTGVKSFNVEVTRGTSHALGKWPTLTIEGARKQARVILGQLAEGRVPDSVAKRRNRRQARIEGRPGTLRALLVQYREHACVKIRTGAEAVARIERVFKRLLDLPLEKLSLARVEDVLVKRESAGKAKATIAKDIALLKRALSWAVEREDLAANPLAKLRPPRFDNRRVRYLTDAERQRLFEALAARDAAKKAARARTIEGKRQQHAHVAPLPEDGYCDALEPAVRISLCTGLRRGELLALDWSDVNLESKLLAVRSAYAKSGKSRHIPLNAEAINVLTRWEKQTGGVGRLFPHESVRAAWEALLTSAKLEDFHWHDLRHDFASRLAMRGVDLNTLRELLGHAEISMSLRYAHLAPAHLRSAVETLDSTEPPARPKVVEFTRKTSRRVSR